MKKGCFVLLVMLYISEIAYGSVRHSVGVAFKDNESVSDIEHHQYFESGHHHIRYYDSELRVLLAKELNYPELPQHPVIKQRDFLRETEITGQVDGQTAMTEIAYLRGQKSESFQFELTESVFIDAGFDAYIRENWRSFERKPVQEFSFAVIGKRKFIKMQIVRSDSNANGASFLLRPKSWLLRALAPEISLRYDERWQLKRYKGFSNLKQLGEGRNVVINFEHYRSDLPLSLPLPEWVPEVSRL
jgi:hypothetical protein